MKVRVSVDVGDPEVAVAALFAWWRWEEAKRNINGSTKER